MSKYKHKITGYIAEETNSKENYKVSEPRNFTIPKWIVENSGDWEEIIKSTFITTDGVTISDGDDFWLVDNQYCAKYYNTGVMSTLLDNAIYLSGKKTFSTKDKCLEYIEDDKPQFSKKDLKDYDKYIEDNLKFDKFPNVEYLINHIKK